MKILLAVLLALSLYPASAQAQKSQPDYLSIFSTAARQYFGGPTGTLPPCGQPKFEWHSVKEMGADRGADAMLDQCVIRFVKEYWDHSDPGELGLTIMHEWGHLYERSGGFGVINATVDGSHHSTTLLLMKAGRADWEDIPQIRARIELGQRCKTDKDGSEDCVMYPQLRHKPAVRIKEK